MNYQIYYNLPFVAKPASSSGLSDLETIHERYMTCLRVYTQHMYPQQTTRFQDLLVRLPEVSTRHFHVFHLLPCS